MKRNRNIDFLKGVAAILVIFGHVIQYGSIAKPYSEDVIYKIIYSFHMPLFMFLSGYTAWFSLKKTQSTIKFTMKRFKQLMVPFAVWGLLMSAYNSIGNVIEEKSLFPFLIKNVEMIKTPENGLWFLWALFFISTGHYLIEKIAIRFSGRYRIYLIFLIILLLPLPNLFGIYNIQRMLPYYVIGYIMNKEKLISEKKTGKRMIINFICVVVCAIVSSIWGNQFFFTKEFTQTYMGHMVNSLLNCIVAFVWIFFLLHISIKVESKLLSYLGLFSLDFYVLQVFPVKMVGKLSFFSRNWIVFHLLWASIITVSIILLCWVLSEKILRRFKITSFLLLGK